MTRNNRHRARWWRFTTPVAVLIALAAIALFAASCGDDGDATATPTATASASATTASSTQATTVAPTPTPTKMPLSGEITVFAAASLTDAFKEAGTAFQAANPNTKVTFNFAGSSALATQINQGAPADVFASADSAQMKVVMDAGNASNPTIFVTNLPTVVVPRGSTTVGTFNDLAKSGVRLVLALKAVPIGNYARQILTNASAATGGVSADFSDRVLANLKSEEADVKSVLAKVQLGEADAGVVYTTDAQVAKNGVTLVAIPTQYNVVAQYPIAVVKGAKNAAVAQAWVTFVLSEAGQAILQKYGFGKP